MDAWQSRDAVDLVKVVEVVSLNFNSSIYFSLHLKAKSHNKQLRYYKKNWVIYEILKRYFKSKWYYKKHIAMNNENNDSDSERNKVKIENDNGDDDNGEENDGEVGGGEESNGSKEDDGSDEDNDNKGDDDEGGEGNDKGKGKGKGGSATRSLGTKRSMPQSGRKSKRRRL